MHRTNYNILKKTVAILRMSNTLTNIHLNTYIHIYILTALYSGFCRSCTYSDMSFMNSGS